MDVWHSVWRGVVLVALVVAASTLCAAAAAGSPGPEQTTVTLFPVADATISTQYPNTNYGSGSLYVTNWSGFPPAECALVQFDLASAVPPNAAIDSARLELRWMLMTSGSPNPFPISLAARFVTGAWHETSVTWNTRPSTSAWETQTQVPWGVEGWHGWNATGFAGAWQANPANNHGVEVCGTPDVAEYSVVYASRESGDPSWRPRLVVTYHLTGPSPVRLPLVLSRR